MRPSGLVAPFRERRLPGARNSAWATRGPFDEQRCGRMAAAERGRMSSVSTSPHGAHDDVFIGDSEAARLMRAHDWASTPLGPVTGWASSLKVALGLLLTSRFEMWLGWGEDI